jgi:hypothetical protein
MEEQSILKSIEQLLGIQEDDRTFDYDILVAINSILSVLTQIGVGPSEGFVIKGDTEMWTDFLPENDPRMSSVRSYVYMRVKMLFDPPLSASVFEAMNTAIKEFEWRLNLEAETQEESK